MFILPKNKRGKAYVVLILFIYSMRHTNFKNIIPCMVNIYKFHQIKIKNRNYSVPISVLQNKCPKLFHPKIAHWGDPSLMQAPPRPDCLVLQVA